MNALALTLITERKRRGLTQAQVAASIGVSRAYIVHLEKGQELKRSRALTRLTKLYGVDPTKIDAHTPKGSKTLGLSETEEALVLALRSGNKNKALRVALTLMTGRVTFSVKSDEKTSVLAPLLVEERKKKGWTQEEAASRLGIAGSSLSKLEVGKNKPSLHILKKIALLYDLDFEELLRIKVNKDKGLESLSRSEKRLIDMVRAKDMSTAFEIIDDLIHT